MQSMNDFINFVVSLSDENIEVLLNEKNIPVEELKLFKQGKDFIDKAFELEPYLSDNTKKALVCYCMEKYNRFNGIK